jgi:hypothetical protein
MPKRKVKRAYEKDDGPLSPAFVAALRLEAGKHLPTGEVLFRQYLFPHLEQMHARKQPKTGL